jgi:hypothetical protein
MSSSLRINLNSSTSGLTTLYFVMGVDRQFALADGSALEDYNAAHWPSYAIPATEVGSGTGMYFATIPAGLPRNNYWVDCYLRVGGSGMETYTDTHQGPGAVSWDGAAEVDIASQGSLLALAVKFSGITYLIDIIRALARKDAATPTALAEINAEHDGGSVGTFAPATDSVEGLHDTAIAANSINLAAFLQLPGDNP